MATARDAARLESHKGRRKGQPLLCLEKAVANFAGGEAAILNWKGAEELDCECYGIINHQMYRCLFVAQPFWVGSGRPEFGGRAGEFDSYLSPLTIEHP